MPGARVTRTLPVLDAVAVTAAKGHTAALWAALRAGGAVTGVRPNLGTPVARVWLDARQHVLDDAALRLR